MKRIANKVFSALLFFVILSFVCFIVIKLVPGDPVRNILGIDSSNITNEQIEEVTKEMGFDKPLLTQYGIWIGKALHLDLGTSTMNHQPVFNQLLNSFIPTLKLTGCSLIIMMLLAFPLGIVSALYQNSWIDKFTNALCMLGTAIPGFWLGLILLQVFAVKLQWFPIGGAVGENALFLPSLTLGISMAPPYIRLLRQSLSESMQKDFVRAAKARGISNGRIFFLHIFRDSFLPILTLFGVSIGSLLGGTVVTEVLFSYPGIGKLAIDAIGKKDYSVIQGFLLFLGILVFLVNSLVEIFHSILNPSIRIKESDKR